MEQNEAVSQTLPAEMWSRRNSKIILTFMGLEFTGELQDLPAIARDRGSNGARAFLKDS